MEDIKNTIATNIAELRKTNKLTQLELAEKLNYSDKAISKWERGEAVPDVAVLISTATSGTASPLSHLEMALSE